VLIVFLESLLFVALIDVDGSDCADDDIDNHDDVDDITMMLADGVDVDDVDYICRMLAKDNDMSRMFDGVLQLPCGCFVGSPLCSAWLDKQGNDPYIYTLLLC